MQFDHVLDFTLALIANIIKQNDYWIRKKPCDLIAGPEVWRKVKDAWNDLHAKRLVWRVLHFSIPERPIFTG